MSIVSDASQCRIGLRGTDKNSMLPSFMVLMACLIQLLLAQRKPINKSQWILHTQCPHTKLNMSPHCAAMKL